MPSTIDCGGTSALIDATSVVLHSITEIDRLNRLIKAGERAEGT